MFHLRSPKIAIFIWSFPHPLLRDLCLHDVGLSFRHETFQGIEALVERPKLGRGQIGIDDLTLKLGS